jgi:hypothetical protein
MATNINAAKRYKDINLPFVCPITNRTFESTKGLSIYITKTLKMDHKEYYDNYINHRDNSCFFCGSEGLFMSVGKGYRNLCIKNECLIKSCNSNSVEGIMYRNFITREKAELIFLSNNENQLIKRQKTNEINRVLDPLLFKKRSRNCKEFWIERGFSEEESVLKSEEVMREIHQKTFEKFKINPEKYRSKYNTTIEYYIKKGYSEDDSKNMLSSRQSTFSKDVCIEKYGLDFGLEIWKKRQNKWINTMDSKSDEEKIEINRKRLFNGSGYSKISQKLFWDIYESFPENNVHFEELNSEIIRYDKHNKRHYRYDYFDFTTKKVIEFNGDYWHCNPDKYDENYIHTVIKMDAKTIWDRELQKIEWIKNRNYNVLVVWESEYRKNPKQILQKCIDFLNN